MRDHKPECVLSDPCSADEPRHGFCGNSDLSWCMHCEQQCICDRIKRAEDRVLDAAREAVAAVPHGISWGTGLHIHRDRALAAIEALRGNK